MNAQVVIYSQIISSYHDTNNLAHLSIPKVKPASSEFYKAASEAEYQQTKSFRSPML